MNIEAHESIPNVLNELYERLRLADEERQDYDQRVARAIRRDRAEVIKTMKTEDR